MKRVLIAWELGGGMGHVMRAGALARAFEQCSVETVACLADLADSPHTRWPARCRILQAPRGSRLPGHAATPSTFGELLYSCGYDDGNQLSALVTAWDHLLEIFRPDLVVVDHAPTAQLAARINAVTVARIGSGFFAPPPVAPTPCYRTWEPVNRERALRAEALVLANINAIFAVCGAGSRRARMPVISRNEKTRNGVASQTSGNRSGTVSMSATVVVPVSHEHARAVQPGMRVIGITPGRFGRGMSGIQSVKVFGGGNLPAMSV